MTAGLTAHSMVAVLDDKMVQMKVTRKDCYLADLLDYTMVHCLVHSMAAYLVSQKVGSMAHRWAVLLGVM